MNRRIPAFGNLFGSVYESFNLAGTPDAEIRFVPKRSFYVKTAVIAGNRDPLHQGQMTTVTNLR